TTDIIAHRQNHIELPKIHEITTVKKEQIIAGNGTTVPNKVETNIPITIPTIDVTNPINRALGAYGKNIGTSNAGFAPGTNFNAIPLNAGTISPKNILTP